MKTTGIKYKGQLLETVRDITKSQVEKFADLNGLNIQSEQNYKDARQILFDFIKKPQKTYFATQFELVNLNTVKSKKATKVVKPLTKRGIINTTTSEIVAYIPDFAVKGVAEGLLAILNSNRTISLPERD